MNTLVFDTETTGMCDFRLPPSHASQPRLVQLGVHLYDSAWNLCAEVNLIIQPFGFDIPIAAAKVHGIDTAKAKSLGVAELTALDVFDSLLNVADIVVAHNIDYDTLVIRHAWHIWHRAPNRNLMKCQFCTMRAYTDICKIPSKFKDGEYKWPSLQEAYKHCFGKEFENAHDAMADVKACAAIYYRQLCKNTNSLPPSEQSLSGSLSTT